MRIVWSRAALADRDAIFEHIGSDNLRAAVETDAKIDARIEGLTAFPLSGRPGRLSRTRELVISETPFIAAYRVDGDDVVVLRILHGARLWPDDLA